MESAIIRIGSSFDLSYSGAEPRADRGVVLMALGSETHSFDQNQRYVPLVASRSSAGHLTVQAPANSTFAPEGDYLLFVLSDQGVPSEGRIVHIQ